MVYLLTGDKFSGKSWSGTKQEVLASEMGKAGLTESGGALTHQSVRTLLANLPKYLGFIYIDESTTPPRLIVTDVGQDLIKFHSIENLKKQKSLKSYKYHNSLIEISPVFLHQMLKLIITNPIILNDCKNILVFPFRLTLKLLLELDYLDREEIGYILFHAKSEDEFQVLVEKIKNLRSLPPENRTKEIEAYEKTEEGKLTLVKAPSAGYYMYLCLSTGICDKKNITVNKTKKKELTALFLKNKEDAKQRLNQFKDVEIYNFKDDWFLWKEYFCNPKRKFPPFDATIKTNVDGEIIVSINGGNTSKSGFISKNCPHFSFAVFPGEEYEIVAYRGKSNNPIYSKKIQFSKKNPEFELDLKGIIEDIPRTKLSIVSEIKEFFSDKYNGFDKDYYSKLKTVEFVTGKQYVDSFRRGGRLEFLFAELLNHLKNEKIIDEVFWYGNTVEYGICYPAPGGKNGYPDIVFEIDDYLFVLELTTIKGVRAQWNSSEASSVPDHIAKAKKEFSNKNVIGIFSAPSIHSQLEQNLILNAKKEKVGMIFEPCELFAELLAKTNRQKLKNELVKKSLFQLSK